MSYMGGQRYVGGGGQIFPNQNQSFQPLQRQYQAQVMQMQYQLQQKIQSQMPKPQLNPNARNDFNKGNKQNASANQNKPDANQSNDNSNNRPNANQKSNIAAKGADSKSVQNQRNANEKPNQNQLNKGKDTSNNNGPAKPNATLPNKDNKTNTPQKDIKPNVGALNETNQNKPQFGGKAQSNQGNQQPQFGGKAQGNQGAQFGGKPQGNQGAQFGGKAQGNQGAQFGGKPQGNQGAQQSQFGGKAQNNQGTQQPQFGGKPQNNQGNQYGGKAQNNQGNQQSQFGGKAQNNQGPQQNQQGAMMNRLPPPPPPLMQSPQKQDIKTEADNSINRGQQNRYNQNSDYYDSQNQGRQNQQDNRGSYGRGRGGAQKNASGSTENYYNRSGSGRNMNNSANNNDFRSSQGRSAQQQSGNYSGSSNYKGSRNYYGGDKLKDRLEQMFSGPPVDLPPLDTSEKKFNAYAKLFIGNIAKNSEQDELVALFEKFGEIGPVYLNKESSFAFIHLDYKANASKAMRELDNTLFKNRHLKVRFSTINEGIKIKNISPYVSNELLEKCFSVFGVVESCKVIADDRGISKGEGIILFRDKKSAVLAIKKCQEECFFLSGALRPVVVTALEPTEENVDGVPEATLPKNDEYQTERNITPHFADSGTFEFEFGVQWKQLYNMYDEKKSILDRDFQIEIDRLEKKMVLAKVEYETEKLRKELAQREAESAHLRRHFDLEPSSAMSAQAPASASGSYDSYSAPAKRPLDQTYDTAMNGPYDRPAAGGYNDTYDRSAYAARSSSDYDRSAYEQNYASAYGREEFRRDAGGYGREDPYDRTPQIYDHAGDMPAERPLYDTPAAEPGYPEAAVDQSRVSDAYKAPSKRPRY